MNTVSKAVVVLFIITGSFALLSALALIAATKNVGFAEWYSSTVSFAFRCVLSFLTSVVPFSLAELVVILSPLIVVGLLVLFFVKRKHIATIGTCVLSGLCILFTLFVNTFGICYFRQPIEENMALNKKPITRGELYENAAILSYALTEASKNVSFDESGASVNPHSKNEMDKLLLNGYSKLSKDFSFLKNVPSGTKRILLSKYMTYTHISGIYIPFTGEANVNTNYPDYVVAFSTAHEMAHQRGIAGEDEANFVAYLACMASGDDYLRYSALLSMYDYHLDAALEHDREIYDELVEITDANVLKEMYAYYLFFQKYRNSKASKVASEVNDNYLKTMGNDDGVKSYGLVIELYNAYIKKYNT